MQQAVGVQDRFIDPPGHDRTVAISPRARHPRGSRQATATAATTHRMSLTSRGSHRRLVRRARLGERAVRHCDTKRRRDVGNVRGGRMRHRRGCRDQRDVDRTHTAEADCRCRASTLPASSPAQGSGHRDARMVTAMTRLTAVAGWLSPARLAAATAARPRQAPCGSRGTKRITGSQPNEGPVAPSGMATTNPEIGMTSIVRREAREPSIARSGDDTGRACADRVPARCNADPKVAAAARKVAHRRDPERAERDAAQCQLGVGGAAPAGAGEGGRRRRQISARQYATEKRARWCFGRSASSSIATA